MHILATLHVSHRFYASASLHAQHCTFCTPNVTLHKLRGLQLHNFRNKFGKNWSNVSNSKQQIHSACTEQTDVRNVLCTSQDRQRTVHTGRHCDPLAILRDALAWKRNNGIFLHCCGATKCFVLPSTSLFTLKQIWIISTDFHRDLQYEISRKYV